MASRDYAGKSAYHGAVASTYEADRRQQPLWEQEQEFVRDWVQTLPAGATLLDIPTGTGRFLEIFLARQLHVLAQDISKDMLAEIRRQHPALASARLEISEGDAEHLALADDTVDVVVCWRLLHLVPLPVVRGVLHEFRRVCRGPMAVQVFAVDPRPEQGGVGGRLKALLRPVWQRLRPHRSRTPATPWSHIPSYSHREPRLLAAFAAAGLRVDRTHTFDPAAPFPTRVYFLSRAAAPGRPA